MYKVQGELNEMSHFFKQLKRVKLNEIMQAWKLPIALICSLFYRLHHKDLWIVCEDKNEARDNGYWFFKYVRENHPNQECVYAILKESPDFKQVSRWGATVEFGSLKHWIMYFASTKKISSQKSGNPNAAIFYFLEVYGIFKDKMIFLQHGVIKDDLKWLYYNVTKINRFICGAYPEWMYVNTVYGYPKGNVCYTGLCRFDGLHDIRTERLILIMPTWREWIADEDERLKEYEGTTEIPRTTYFLSWIDFIKDIHIRELSKKYNVKFIFFPHRNMQKYMKYFPVSDKYIEIACANDYNVQELLKKASMLVTDYSSVFFDMVYMKKPVSFYQFDYERFRAGQYSEGYFHYDNTVFGKSHRKKEDVFSDIERFICSKFKVSNSYIKAHNDFFRLYDTDNCKRVYDIVKNL